MPVLSPTPQLPRLLALPLKLAPGFLYRLPAVQVLNRVFAREVAAGELEFLRGKGVSIRVRDAGVSLELGFDGRRFHGPAPGRPADLAIAGSLFDFLSLVTGREDPDTLFFQRRLRMSGSTDLGVHLKNFLAAVDPDGLPLATLVRPALGKGLDWYERLA